MTGKEKDKIEELTVILNDLRTQIHQVNTDMTYFKETNLSLLEFKADFKKDNGWIPKIVNNIRDAFRKDFKLFKEEVRQELDKFPCKDLKFGTDGILQSMCRIANESEPLKSGEKEIKG